MKCQYCNQVSGGRTFGDEQYNFRSLLRKTWQEGMHAALINTAIRSGNCREMCPYDEGKDVVLWYAWVGGAYHGMCWRHEKPDEVAEWLSKEQSQSNRLCTCDETCENPCKGECGCEKCHQDYGDFLSAE